MVLDASAILAFLHDEKGSDIVRAAIDGGVVSAVNWSEVLQKAVQYDIQTSGMRDDFAGIGMQFIPFDITQAEIAGALWEQTRPHGLSLGDRACLALALQRQEPVLTADQAWYGLDIDVEVELLR